MNGRMQTRTVGGVHRWLAERAGSESRSRDGTQDRDGARAETPGSTFLHMGWFSTMYRCGAKYEAHC